MKNKIMGLSLLCVLTAIPATLSAQTTGVTNAWTGWLDRDQPSGDGDSEMLGSFLTERPTAVCATPSAIEARIVGTTQVFTPAMTTPNALRSFSAAKGLQCYNADQPNKSCPDFEVRFLCAPATLGQTKAVLEKMETFKLQTAVAQGNAIAVATFKRDSAMEELKGRFSFDMEGKITAFNDLAEGADEKSGDGIFTAFTTIDVADITKTQETFLAKLNSVQNPIVREFSGRAVVSTTKFVANSSAPSTNVIKGLTVTEAPRPLPAAIPPALVLPENALVINDRAVVANSTLTFDACNTDATGNNINPNAAWSFKTLLSNLNDETTSGMTDQQFANDWLRNWINNSSVNGFSILARPNLKDFFQGWDGVNAATLNMDRLPFRLLAIVNRIDLAAIPAYGVSTANKPGEIRFVFGLITRDSTGFCRNNGIPGSADQMTAIFEYRDATTGCSGLKDLANKWVTLDTTAIQFGRNSANYLNALKAITDTVTAPNAKKLNQLRTNDFAFDGIGRFNGSWQLREFVIDPTTKKLAPTTIKQTPDPVSFRSPGPGSPNEILMKDYLQANSSSILCETHSVPPLFNAQNFLGASADYLPNTTWLIQPDVVPASFPTCYTSSVVAGSDAGLLLEDKIRSEIRHKFALNTCDDCHAAETDTFFVHINPSNRALSRFMTGVRVTDGITPIQRDFNDLARRNQSLVGTAATSCTIDPRILNSFQARQARFGFIH
ncbi:MAG TPA: hypothetical protein VLC79_06935 [Cellvibrio sp.]|nr:hypothetical protein [Cellvibrio sp.]